jgi:lysophospholipase L1-like esterase
VSWRFIRRNALLALGSFAVYAGIAEVWLRCHADPSYYVWPPGAQFVFEPRPGLLPGVEGVARVTINELGMRSEPLGDDPRYRLLAVGGSTTACSSLDDDEAWPYLVQERLNEALGPGATWVGNVGRPGHTTSQHVLQVDRLLEQHPQLDGVLLLVGINDLLLRLSARRGTSGRGGPMDPLETAFAVLPRGAVERPWYERSALGFYLASGLRRNPRWAADAELRPDGSHIERWREFRRRAGRLLDSLPDLSRAGWLAGYAARLDAIVDAARRRGARLVFMTQPALWRDDLSDAELALLWTGGPPLHSLEEGADYYTAGALAEGMRRFNETLLEVCRKRRVECLDLAGRLPRDSSIFYDDAHFTEEGARRVAELVARFLLATPPLVQRAHGPSRPDADYPR